METVKRTVSILMALALVIALGGLIWADQRYPAPAASAGQAAAVEVAPGDSLAVCPGALALPGEGEDEVVYDPRFDPNPTSVEAITRTVVEGGNGGRANLLEGDQPTILAEPLSVATTTVETTPFQVEAYSSDTAPAIATGGVYQHIADGDLRGVAAASCVPPAIESWIVAGSTEPGSSARLILVNPGYTTVTADLTLWDGAGLVEAVGLTGLVVPAGSQRVVLLEGFVGDAARLAVRVTAAGGELAAFLQHSRLQGLVQGGVEIAVPSAAPATTVMVPGLNLTESSFDSPRVSTLRVLNPGTAPAQIAVQLWGPDGKTTLPGLEDAQVNPGLVTDLSLGGLPAGYYAAVISSDQPVVAAGFSLRAEEDSSPEEFAWSAAPVPAEHGFVVLPASDLSATLTAGSGVDSTLTVTPVNPSGELGEPTTFELKAGTIEAWDLETLGAAAEDAALEFQWEAEPGLLALVVSADQADGELISVLAPEGRWATATTVKVYPALP
ncbi:MAG: DUF5719 family protein [Bifidobacteriaceae bacterium]|jgi:hypothetical protein|nr:DUF5719 family protein [Bifidobacteriaceae bacterium]